MIPLAEYDLAFRHSDLELFRPLTLFDKVLPVKKFMLLAGAGLLCFGVSQPAFAQNLESGDKGHLSFGIGYFDVLDDESAADLRLEYRSGQDLWTENLHPWIGLEGTSEGSLWGGAGLLYDIALDEEQSIYLTPSFGGGFYTKGGGDLDLDYPLQFRTQLELSYEFTSRDRIGVAVNHLSNAGLGDSNPGTEVLSVYWHVPFYGPF